MIPGTLIPVAAPSANDFPPTSRYAGIPVAQLTTPDGRVIAYLHRRLLPQPDQFALLQYHTVTQGERLDNIAAHYLDDPEQFWRICDANGVMRPDELEMSGRQIRITLPQGIPGAAPYA
jgi:hypothetical protein